MEGLDQQTFDKELAKYSVVRNASFQGEVKLEVVGGEQRPKSSLRRASLTTPEQVPARPHASEVPFWDTLGRLLTAHLGRDEGEAVYATCKQLYQDYVCSFSYDDLERLAHHY